MDKPDNGKLIRRICFAEPQPDTCPYLDANSEKGESMEYASEYHGDHDENWILFCENGKETSRHNTKYIASIIWEEKK